MRTRKTRAAYLLLAGWLAIGASSAEAIDWAKKDFRPFGYHTQEHFWLTAGGTFACAQVYQYYGMERTPAIALSAAQIMALGIGKEFVLDNQPAVNDLIADSLGVLLATVANVTVHFDFPHRSHAPTDSRVLAPEPVDFER